MKFKSVLVVLYNPQRPELFFSVAAIMRKWESYDNAVVAIAADPGFLDDEDNLHYQLAKELAFSSDDQILRLEEQDCAWQKYQENDGFLKNIWSEEDQDCINCKELLSLIPSLVNYIILDIGPQNANEMAHIINFVDRHENEIIFWLDTRHIWQENQIFYCNHYRPIVLSKYDLSPLEVLQKINYKSPLRWLKAEKALSRLSLEGLRRSPLARRYFQAISASAVLSKNLKINSNHSIFMAIALECADNIRYAPIDDMCDCYQDMLEITEIVTKAITTNWSFLKKLKRCWRPAGYLELRSAPSHTDIFGILQKGSGQFPWLFVLVYRLESDGLEKIEAVSAKLGQHWKYFSSSPEERVPKKYLLKELYLKIRYAVLPSRQKSPAS